jgi:NRAMP (natural resistance-associated macrophage protein)-like metal ion transporter
MNDEMPSTPRPKRAPWLVAGRRYPRPMRGVPARLRRSPILRFLAILGPGLVAASAGNDAGGIATYSSAGASYGYSLLWTMVIITFCLSIVQLMAARLGAVTGKGLADLIRERFSIRRTAFAMLALLLANTGLIISEFAGVVAALELFGVPRFVTSPLMAIVLWWLIVKGSYQRVERIFVVMTFGFFTYVAAAFLANPDWGDVLRNSVVPSVQLDSGFLVMVVALIGTTITPYMQVYQQTTVVEKGITTLEYPLARADAVGGVLFSNLISAFIIIATAATLFIQGVTVESAADAAKALEPAAGNLASALFAVGLFGGSMLAAGVVPLATAFSVAQAFGWESGTSKEFREAPIFYSVFTALVVIGALVSLIPGLPLIQLLIGVQVVNGVLLPVVLVFLTRMAGDRELMGDYANGRWFSLAAWVTTIVVSILALGLIVVTIVLPLFGVEL